MGEPRLFGSLAQMFAELASLAWSVCDSGLLLALRKYGLFEFDEIRAESCGKPFNVLLEISGGKEGGGRWLSDEIFEYDAGLDIWSGAGRASG